MICLNLLETFINRTPFRMYLGWYRSKLELAVYVQNK